MNVPYDGEKFGVVGFLFVSHIQFTSVPKGFSRSDLVSSPYVHFWFGPYPSPSASPAPYGALLSPLAEDESRSFQFRSICPKGVFNFLGFSCPLCRLIPVAGTSPART